MNEQPETGKEFRKWLEEASPRVYEIRDGDRADLYIKAEKNKDFSYLYHYTTSEPDGVKRFRTFDYAGIFCKSDGLIYDACGEIEKFFPGIEWVNLPCGVFGHTDHSAERGFRTMFPTAWAGLSRESRIKEQSRTVRSSVRTEISSISWASLHARSNETGWRTKQRKWRGAYFQARITMTHSASSGNTSTSLPPGRTKVRKCACGSNEKN